MGSWAKTTLSDEEVIYEEQQGKLYFLKYKIEGSEDFNDCNHVRKLFFWILRFVLIKWRTFCSFERQKSDCSYCGRVIPIIEDEYVDIEFGTGCLKVTPAHDMNDKALGEKHNLEIIDIFNEDATLTVLDCTFKVKIVLWFVKRQRIRNHWCFGKTETL
jgi:valyl-tRNA synthetase